MDISQYASAGLASARAVLFAGAVAPEWTARWYRMGAAVDYSYFRVSEGSICMAWHDMTCITDVHSNTYEYVYIYI